MKEWHRTVLLVVLLIVAVGLIIWLRTDFEAQSLRTLGYLDDNLTLRMTTFKVFHGCRGLI